MAALGQALGITLTDLRNVIDRSDHLYRLVGRKPKKQGGFREIREALEPLKSLQKRIQLRILGAVDFPDYIMGGVKDPAGKRGYIRNAELHAGAEILISEDIADFFPSISTFNVRDIFEHLFHFAPEPATALARLCTRFGEVPQGASTSTSLANLVLFHREPAIAEQLSKMGFRYTRFVDDVNVSSALELSNAETATVVRTVRGMIEGAGFVPKRAKQHIFRPGHRMHIHNLNVNSTASIPSDERKRVRAIVFQLEMQLRTGELGEGFRQELDRATSLCARIRSLHPREGQRLMARVRAVRSDIRVTAATHRPGAKRELM